MGTYDTVILCGQMGLGGIEKCQTKDLECRLNEYLINPGGFFYRLIREDGWPTKMILDKHCGVIHFYSDVSRYTARFWEGHLQELIQE